MRYPVFLAFTFSILLSMPGQARDTRHLLPLSEALSSADFKEKLDPDIRLYFGDAPHPQPEKRLGEFVSNRKTNSVGKSDQEACRWVLLSALLSLQKRAAAEGGNAVVNIRSYYKKKTFSSDTEYECHAGAVVAGVALKGEVVRLHSSTL
ncbi:MAG: excinuclease ATPase subunit [Porticoccaceae bacterium]